MNPTLPEITSLLRAAVRGEDPDPIPPSLADRLAFGNVKVQFSRLLTPGSVPIPIGDTFVIAEADYRAATNPEAP